MAEDLLPDGVTYTISGEYQNSFVTVTIPSGLSAGEQDAILRTVYNEVESVIADSEGRSDASRITLVESEA